MEDSGLQPRAADGQRDLRDWFAGQSSIRVHVRLRCGWYLGFCRGLLNLSVVAGRSRWAAYLTGFMALPAAGIGIFAYPNPLYNVFGLSELIGYQAPLVMALTWRRDPRAKTLVAVSWIMSVVVWSGILLNLSSLDRQGVIWA